MWARRGECGHVGASVGAVIALKAEEQKAKSGDLEAGQAWFCSFATVQLCELGQCA